MVEKLLQYLLLHKRVALPGIGTLTIVNTPAIYSYTEKKLIAPKSEYILEPRITDQDKNAFIEFLAREDPENATSIRAQWKQFVAAYQLAIFSSILHWNGIGSFEQKSGKVHFQSDYDSQFYFPDIAAEPVIRANSTMTIKVGEDERSKAEMEEILSGKVSKWPWWAYALVIVGLVAVGMAIYWFEYMHKR